MTSTCLLCLFSGFSLLGFELLYFPSPSQILVGVLETMMVSGQFIVGKGIRRVETMRSEGGRRPTFKSGGMRKEVKLKQNQI
jgi:hypothetical protein